MIRNHGPECEVYIIYDDLKVFGKGFTRAATLGFHWARLIRLLYAAERTLELSRDEEITSEDLRSSPGSPGEGVGIVEAAGGTLIHHYQIDEDALIKKVNSMVATTNNHQAMCMSIRDSAKALIHGNKVSEGLLNMVEMAFRAYDPCFSCATHFAIDQMPLRVKIHDHNKKLLKTLRRYFFTTPTSLGL